MEIILKQKAEFQKFNLYRSMSSLEQQNKITTNSIDEHKPSELHLIICGKTDFVITEYVIKETI